MPAWRTISLWMDQLDEPLIARPELERDLDVDVELRGVRRHGKQAAEGDGERDAHGNLVDRIQWKVSG